MKNLICFALCLFLIITEGCAQPPVTDNNVDPTPLASNVKKKKIKLALLLDTSNSMDGLIEQAKSQLWKIVNELSLAKCDGLKPDIEIALFEYGNDGLSAETGFIRMVCPLSSDLDNLSKNLFSLKTNGGSEFCGQVIQSAIKLLNWSNDTADLQMIFIAGNEAFDQGSVNYAQSCVEAKNKNIVVNSIYCGNFNEGINSFWKNGADITSGSYMSIDHNSKTIFIATPYDNQIAALNDSLNKTYIGYGKEGERKKQMQEEQDRNADQYGTANKVSRTVSKSSSVYKNESWDLIDAQKVGAVEVEKLTADQLPAEMKSMSVTERKVYIDANAKKREEINVKIAELNINRTKYIAEQENKTTTNTNTLENTMIQSIRKQASKKNMVFE